MTVYALFDPNKRLIKIFKNNSSALAWVSEAYKNCCISQDKYSIHVYTDIGPFIIIEWEVLE